MDNQSLKWHRELAYLRAVGQKRRGRKRKPAKVHEAGKEHLAERRRKWTATELKFK